MRFHNAILAIVIVALAASCSDSGDNTGPEPGPNHAPVLADMAASHSVQAGEVVREPVSASDPDGDEINFRYLNPGFVSMENLSQGDGSASATMVIAPTAADVGTYEITVEAVDSHGATDDATCTIEVTAATASGCTTGTCLVMDNTSTLTVEVVNFSSCSSPTWGPDRLEGNVIAPGGSFEWDVTPGCYDVRGIASTGTGTCSNMFWGLNITQGERETVVYDGCD
jgi:hypothetical protein